MDLRAVRVCSGARAAALLLTRLDARDVVAGPEVAAHYREQVRAFCFLFRVQGLGTTASKCELATSCLVPLVAGRACCMFLCLALLPRSF